MKVRKYHLSIVTVLSANAFAAEWAWDLGFGAGYVTITDAVDMDEQQIRPNLQLGAFRQDSENWRVGTSVEWLAHKVEESSKSTNVLMWRLGDIDYRLSENLAFNLHGGFARYYREQPSYGYGLGIGTKYRLGEHSYLSLKVTSVDVDVSSGVPTDDDAPTKNELRWATVSLHIIF